MERLAEVRPARLLVVADGPRKERPDDLALCAEAQRIATAPAWRCEVLTDVSETNLGCRDRIASGLDWVFETVEAAIVLEDDCLPAASFFPFCGELLARYRDDQRVGAILGTNLSGAQPPSGASYFFSRVFHPWGWASWRRVWRDYDRRLAQLDTAEELGILESAFADPRVRGFFADKFARVRRGEIDTWDFQLGLTLLARSSLVVTPAETLVANLGCAREDATHTADETTLGTAAAAELELPLRHPSLIAPFRRADLAVEQICLALRVSG
ncbi:hypothetical protein SAMN06265365_1475 [Tistlia consotensis]|uniref:Glycosyl transferase family 2 n=1 Tax=Tistlia consotensis USBA 355 TaxID=560819 RepID=A0A1Y6CS16_9PROT|nr:hypothetical protein [Tistlia consotensis]SMF73516.1 hypothetical protein SAMN05428998_13227 [Tistlia consotensis USBA 355]SNS30152.1 hypothetical protein SAMN06265365_1475 [Tistlia consotensis]